jgi:type IV pilus assembly protein PilE
MSIVNKYNSDAANAPITVSPAGATGTTVNYNVTVAYANATSFVLTATPANGMSGDACGTFTLSNTGLRTVSSGTVEECWNR